VGVTPKVVNRLRGLTSGLGVDLDTEAGRAFLQERIAFFNRVAFFVSGSFFVAGALFGPYYVTHAAALHAATLVVSLLAWQVCRRGPALSIRVLEWVDALAVALVLVGFSAQALVVPPEFAGEVVRSLALILTQVVIVRAVLVPSTTLRTAAVSVLAALPAGAVLLWMPPPPGASLVVSWNDRFWSSLWIASAVVVASLVSHVIYGLREEIHRARQLGQYTLEDKLGEGGMGAVYRARHAMLRRPTAIKLLPPEKAGEAALARFEREVQLTASLSHPNTVSVFDYGRTPDGIFYYAMEYLDGTDLDALVREDGPQPPSRVAQVLRQVASALVEAHGIGLIHRDIKPENVILCERGGIPDVAKVVDFGLVRDLEPAAGARLTQSNVIQGTPLYLSPEAIRAPDEVDARSDLYGLGAVGYYLLTGTHVFTGATTVEVCSHHLHSRPLPPSERLGKALPEGLERLVLACLEKEPARRPGSAASLRDALLALPDPGDWSEARAREWWERWHRTHVHRSVEGRARPTRTLDVAVGARDRPRA
jgi:hypothetical protein